MHETCNMLLPFKLEAGNEEMPERLESSKEDGLKLQVILP